MRGVEGWGSWARLEVQPPRPGERGEEDDGEEDGEFEGGVHGIASIP